MQRSTGNRWLAALLLAAVASAAFAEDYAAGEAAWQRGEHAAALAQWLPLAEAGQARAQFAVGLAYDRGQGVERDAATAARWYRRAAAQEREVFVVEHSVASDDDEHILELSFGADDDEPSSPPSSREYCTSLRSRSVSTLRACFRSACSSRSATAARPTLVGLALRLSAGGATRWA